MKKPELKYISDYLNELDSPIKEMALSNHLEYANSAAGIECEVIHKKVIGIYEAIVQGFFWHSTPEGRHFWDQICQQETDKFFKQYPDILKQLNKNKN